MNVTLLGQGVVLDTIEAECRQRGWAIVCRTDQPMTPEALGQADLAFASRYRHILRKPHLDACPVLNVHNGYLPWNKGAHPNVWPLIDGSPAGVTVHWMDEGVDTGPIVGQNKVPVLDTDTAGTLYERLEEEAVDCLPWLFRLYDMTGSWPSSTPQDPKAGTRHYARDLAELDYESADPTCLGSVYDEHDPAERLYNRLRARTFPGYPGLRIGNVRATITLTPVED